MSSERLIYDKLPMTSPPKKPPVVIDIAKLNADQGFGFNKYLPSNSDSSDQDYHQQIFESPYFDYRRAHSVVRLFFDNLLVPIYFSICEHLKCGRCIYLVLERLEKRFQF